MREFMRAKVEKRRENEKGERRGGARCARVANTYLDISRFDLSLGLAACIFTCIIYISRSWNEGGVRPARAGPPNILTAVSFGRILGARARTYALYQPL